jgi:hypothetical protein
LQRAEVAQVTHRFQPNRFFDRELVACRTLTHDRVNTKKGGSLVLNERPAL